MVANNLLWRGRSSRNTFRSERTWLAFRQPSHRQPGLLIPETQEWPLFVGEAATSAHPSLSQWVRMGGWPSSQELLQGEQSPLRSTALPEVSPPWAQRVRLALPLRFPKGCGIPRVTSRPASKALRSSGQGKWLQHEHAGLQEAFPQEPASQNSRRHHCGSPGEEGFKI